MIRAFIAWLNKRFPEQLVVTKGEFNEMREDMFRMASDIQGITIRMSALEVQVKRLNDQQGFVSSKKGAFALER